MKMRWSTFVRDHGPVNIASAVTHEEWMMAVADRRFATVYHGDSDFCTPLVAVVRHGMVNTMCKIVFTRPLPAGVDTIIGLRNSQEAYDLVNG